MRSGWGRFLLLPGQKRSQGAARRGPILTLYGVVFAIFVQALPCTAEGTLCPVRGCQPRRSPCRIRESGGCDHSLVPRTVQRRSGRRAACNASQLPRRRSFQREPGQHGDCRYCFGEGGRQPGESWVSAISTSRLRGSTGNARFQLECSETTTSE
jgi:hypothetical protein